MGGEWFDLSQEFFEGMPRSKALPEGMKSGEIISQALEVTNTVIMRFTQYTFLTHMGTHIDAPAHFVASGRTIEEMELSKFHGTGVVLALARPSLTPITAKDLEETGPRVKEGDIVFIHTGWGDKFALPEYHEHPYLAEDAVDWLIAQKVKMVGIDAVTVDLPPLLRYPGFDFPAHRKLLEKEILIAEHLYLANVVGKRVYVLAFPIKLRGADGAPARIVARLES